MCVAFIVQRCGIEVNGGAEAHCLQIAQRMSKHWDTEVLTTCALDYMTWENFYPSGPELVGGTTIRRFPVDEMRDVEAFNRLSGELNARQAHTTLPEQEEWMRAQGPMSSALLEHVAQHSNDYDAFIFFGYLYATTYFCLPLVQGKAFLAPLAHDEWTIYFSMWNRFFARPQRLIFNTTFERDFLRLRFPQLELRGPVVGVGIDEPKDARPERFRRRYAIDEPFLLYVGRIDESKGCRTMIDHFTAAKRRSEFRHQLVLAGAEVMAVPFHDDIIHLGFVDDEQKYDAMAACDWLVMPSPHESLSMVLLETWAAGRPAIVSADADVLTGHCRRANAGLWYRNYDEFVAAVRSFDESTKTRLGANGRQYVEANYSWSRVETDYLALLSGAEK